ncbi:MAG: hypothetical protein SH850_29140, partial [Planctomycetaceae bacterium]|nr:hypothetical protein [Planctomycetaceae bacterium]
AALSLWCSACIHPPARGQVQNLPTERPAAAPQMASRSDSGVVRLGGAKPPAFVENPIQQVAYAETDGRACPPDAILSCPPEPRFPVAGENPFAIGMPACDVSCQPSPFHYPDEYLCDGGDRELPVHYGIDTRDGLDTEDTVGEFLDHNGKERTSKSNRVCVYAPRFASVRTVSLPYEEGTTIELAGITRSGSGGELRTQLAPHLGNKNSSATGMRMRSRASGLESERLPGDVSQRQRPHEHDKIQNTFQDLNFFQTGIFEQADLARLNLGINAALVWSREEYPVIQGKIETATTGLSDITTSVLTVVDDQKSNQPGQLRLVKTADKDAAELGDVITFTIRYDNLGPREIEAVRVVDNLTPRLEYVTDSATSDRAGRLVVQDNGEGSLVLIWELADPLVPKTGGVVTFQAKVR